MLIKNGLKDIQGMDNQRVVTLADVDPKLVTSELRERLCEKVEPNVVKTQWGDGSGARSVLTWLAFVFVRA